MRDAISPIRSLFMYPKEEKMTNLLTGSTSNWGPVLGIVLIKLLPAEKDNLFLWEGTDLIHGTGSSPIQP